MKKDFMSSTRNKFFDEFKSYLPTNEQLCRTSAKRVIGEHKKDYVMTNFSELLEEMQDDIYESYLREQEECGQKVIDEQIAKFGTINFSDVDKFLMSIFQSRKSRAGKAFEFIIRELFIRADVPFSEQITIDGAKPDFVMPSAEYFEERPLDCMLFTAKRTLRERWRQVVTEANKSYSYFLATLDDKVTESQLKQAATHKLYIVVPAQIKENNPVYSSSYNVLSFEQFFEIHLKPALNRWAS